MIKGVETTSGKIIKERRKKKRRGSPRPPFYTLLEQPSDLSRRMTGDQADTHHDQEDHDPAPDDEKEASSYETSPFLPPSPESGSPVIGFGHPPRA